MRTLFANAVLFEGGHFTSAHDAVLVAAGQIAAIGRTIDLAKMADKTIDLQGAFLCPSFIDSHTHPISGGMTKLSLDLRGVSSREEFIRCVAGYAAKLGNDEWVKGRNWQADFWHDGHPDRKDVDAAVGDRPALLYRFDGHLAVASSKALALAGITCSTPDPAGGLIGRDDSGRPNGILKDEAILLVKKTMGLLGQHEIEKLFEIAADEASSAGIGTLHSVLNLREFEILHGLSERKRLKCRFSCYVSPAQNGAGFSGFLDMASEMKHCSRNNSSARLLGVKFFHDGSLGAATALFQEPYRNLCGHAPGYRGIRCSGDMADFKENIHMSVARHLQPMIHAIGDLAVREVIEIYSGVDARLRRTLRPRIEHVQHIIPGDERRMAELGIVASMQPRHIYYDGLICAKTLSPVAEKNSYALRKMLSAGVAICFGSDWPVVELSPVLGIYSAVSRNVKHMKQGCSWIPEEKISVPEALELFTSASAFAEFAENTKGSIRVGSLADLVVLSADPRHCAESDIPYIKVIRTISGGETVHQAD